MGGCCCATFLGAPIIGNDCAGVQVRADTDIVCCAYVFNNDGVCNESDECYCPDGSRGGPPGSGLASCMNCDDIPANPY